MSTIRTYTGNTFHYEDMSPKDVSIEDIAHALSNICRFTGHVKVHYSVAEHCCRVSDICVNNKMWGLLHDASETYVSDLPRPFKRLIGMEPYRTYEKRVMDVICIRFGLPLGEPAEVKAADMRLLVTEQRDLMVNAAPEWYDVEPLPDPIKPWTAEIAKEAFLCRFRSLL
jgi:uncharacterized protein